jgi:hypothetical protein
MSYERFTADALRALGHDPNKPLPPEGLPHQLHNGVMVCVMSKAKAKEVGIKQRTRGCCPRCGQWFALGNLRQHMHGPIGGQRPYAGCTKA